MTAIVINGHEYSDDGSTANDMQNYGYLAHLLPMIGDVAVVAGEVAADATQTAADVVASASNMAGYSATSATSLTIGAGTQSFTASTGKLFHAGDDVVLLRTSDTSKRMYGRVTSYNATTGAAVIDVSAAEGTGTFSDWTIRLAGVRGAQGVPAGVARRAITGADTVVATDTGKFLDCSGTSYTLGFSACATLGADTWYVIRNGASGTITLDPNGAETIDGAASYVLDPGAAVWLFCDGTTLRKFGVFESQPNQFLHVRDEKASGTAGGTSTTGSNTRTLNTVVKNTIAGASLASSLVTLPAGTYEFWASAPCNQSGNKLTLYNHTDSTTIVHGPSVSTGNTSYTIPCSGQFTLSGTKDVKLVHLIQSGVATQGLGLAANTGVNEVYADLQIRKVL